MARPEVTRKFAVGLFCGGAFHDAAFTRVGGCDVVGLYDWELRMRKVARPSCDAGNASGAQSLRQAPAQHRNRDREKRQRNGHATP